MSNKKEINHKFYEYKIYKHDIYNDEVSRAMDIVKRYIKREKRILTGGMAIDSALKIKNPGKGIYGKNVLPDYDFYTDEHFKDAYEIAQWLSRTNFTDISVIHAMHPSTMKVRIKFIVVADITYVPPHIFKNLPTLHYKGFKIIHPHYQMMDQHRSLSFPYENAPRETVQSARPAKDMKRYDLLYDAYPIHKKLGDINQIKQIGLSKMREIPLKILDGQCIGGFLALIYWVQEMEQLGFKPKFNLGSFHIKNEKVKFQVPEKSAGLALFSDDMEQLYKDIKEQFNIQKEEFYNKFLDKIPRRILLDGEWELLENVQKITADKITPHNIYSTNIQNIMMYMLIGYMLLNPGSNDIEYLMGYLLCRDLLKWGIGKYYQTTNQNTKDKLFRLFPSHKVYGEQNISEFYMVSKWNFNKRNKTLKDPIKDKNKYIQPHKVWDRDLKYKKVPRKYYDFDYASSEIFNFGGDKVDNFYTK